MVDVARQVDQIDELQSMGIMVYYGDTKPVREEEESKVVSGDDRAKGDQNESCRLLNFLNHCMMGLITIQHNGNMIIKINEMYDVGTVGILFTLYHLFQEICVVKPHASSYLSGRQYLVCKGLKQRRPQLVITRLAHL